MATLIKRAPAPVKAKPQVGDQIKFPVWVPLQNIGTTTKEYSGKVTQVNRVTVDAVDENGNTWRVRLDEII
mgnify:CR=1 FL=1